MTTSRIKNKYGGVFDILKTYNAVRGYYSKGKQAFKRIKKRIERIKRMRIINTQSPPEYSVKYGHRD